MNPPEVPPPDRLGHTFRAGRRIAWSEWGARTGAPVLFVTGAAMSSHLGFGAEVLDELNVRLICIDRAGLGRSDPDPEKSFASYAADVEEVLRSERITNPRAVGFSQGAPFALVLSKLVSGIALVSGQDELAHPSSKPLLHPHVAGMVDAIAHDPLSFETSFAKQVDAAGMWQLIINMSAPVDRALYESPEFATAYRAALDKGFAQGPSGYVRDLTLAMRPWPMRPEETNVPVDLWYGRLDTSPVHSPDFGVTLSKRFPSATLHVLPDEGSSLLWTRAREILRPN